MRPSMGSVGDAYDNAMCESFFATLECELLDVTSSGIRIRRGGPSSTSLRDSTTGRRRHSALGYESPVRYEQQAA